MNIQTINAIREQRRAIAARIEANDVEIQKAKRKASEQSKAGNTPAACIHLRKAISLLEVGVDLAGQFSDLVEEEAEAVELMFALVGEIPPASDVKDN